MKGKITIDKKYLWDYQLSKNWVPKTKTQWLWLLERKINYDDWQGITKEMLWKYFPALKKRLDPGRRMMIEVYLKKYGHIKTNPLLLICLFTTPMMVYVVLQ